MAPQRILLDSEGRETRWEITYEVKWRHIRRLTLMDRNLEVQPPLIREAFGFSLDYPPVIPRTRNFPIDHFFLRDWRKRFRDAVERAVRIHLDLPVFLDGVSFRNENLPERLREFWNDEPLWVVAKPVGFAMFPLQSSVNPSQALSWFKNLGFGLASAFKHVHQKGYLALQAPLQSIYFSHITKTYTLTHWMNLVAQSAKVPPDDIPDPFLDQACCAPECLRPGERLTVATDVYAWGKTMLQYLGIDLSPTSNLAKGAWKKGLTFPASIDDLLAAVQASGRFNLPEYMARTLKTAMQPCPDHRYQSMQDLMTVFNDKAAVAQGRFQQKPFPKGNHP